MFLSEMSEAKQELIEIKDFDGDAIQDLVHFAYSSRLTLTVDNVQPLLYAACILQVKKHEYKLSTSSASILFSLFYMNCILYQNLYLGVQNVITIYTQKRIVLSETMTTFLYHCLTLLGGVGSKGLL